jgi:hypothetical protein
VRDRRQTVFALVKKTILTATLFALLAPSIADARPVKGHAKTVRAAVSAVTGVKASAVRYRSKIDRAHDADGHKHIVAHEQRVVRFRAGRATGTLKTDSSPVGAPARVFELKLDPIKPNQ